MDVIACSYALFRRGGVMIRFFALAAVALIVAGVLAVLRLRGEGSTDATARFFTLPTRTVCATQDLVVEASGGYFAAHALGETPREGGRYLVVDVTASNSGTVGVSFSRSYFALVEISGATYEAVSLGDVPDRLDSNIGPWEEMSGQLVFVVPQSFGAGKLTYDDGCGQQAWIVP